MEFYSSHFSGLGSVNCRPVCWCPSYRLNLDVYKSGWRPFTNLKLGWGLPLAPSLANHVSLSADDPSIFGLIDYWVSIVDLVAFFMKTCVQKMIYKILSVIALKQKSLYVCDLLILV